jgi:Flp pilus assembly pilin Flp
MIVERIVPRLRKNRAAAQLIEEALLLSVALVALSLLVGGVDSVLKQAGGFTSNIWNSITSNLNSMFSSAFHW